MCLALGVKSNCNDNCDAVFFKANTSKSQLFTVLLAGYVNKVCHIYKSRDGVHCNSTIQISKCYQVVIHGEITARVFALLGENS